MCFAGAKKNTEQELKKVLQYLNVTNEEVHALNAQLIEHLNGLNGNVSLETANKIYPHKDFSIREDFLSLVRKHYKSDVQLLDYTKAKESAGIINNWVSEKTKQKITNLIQENHINNSVRLILVNAIYFKGNWLHKFDPAKTHKELFHLADGTTKEVDMMALTNKKFNLQINPASLKAMVCEFPYNGKDLSMFIILPNYGINLNEIEAQLNANLLKAILKIEVDSTVKVHVYIPKFKFDSSFEVRGDLFL